jgi:16S rRNA G966 N2-methylase RsmD
MVETDPGALRAIRRNLKATGFEDRVRIYDLDVERALQAIAADQRGVRFDLVLAGPPYAYRNEAGLMSEIARLGLMAGDAEAVFQHSAKRSLPDEAGGLYKCDSRRFGDTALSFYSLNPAARRH